MTEESGTGQSGSASWWEDLLEIFLAPSKVFSRRAGGSFWVPYLVFVVLIAVLAFGLAGPVQPALEADAIRQVEAAAAQNPDFPLEQVLETIPQRLKFAPVMIIGAMAVSVPIVGLLILLVGKAFGSAATLGQAMLIAAFAAYPKAIGFLASGIQGMLMDPAELTGMTRLTLGPARFLDPDVASSGVMQAAVRFDLTILWATVLIAIGVKVIGKVESSRAWGTALTVWLIGFLPALIAFVRS